MLKQGSGRRLSPHRLGVYGPALMRLRKYRLWIAFMEAAPTTGFSTVRGAEAAGDLSPARPGAVRQLPGQRSSSMFSGGFSTIIAMNTPHPSTIVM
jgi:hypothetical protein